VGKNPRHYPTIYPIQPFLTIAILSIADQSKREIFGYRDRKEEFTYRIFSPKTTIVAI